MEAVFRAMLIVVVAAAAAATVYKTVPGISFLLSAAAALLALFLCVGLLGPLADFFRDAIALSDLSGVYTGPLLKCMTISILTVIGEGCARMPDRLRAQVLCSLSALQRRSMRRCRCCAHF